MVESQKNLAQLEKSILSLAENIKKAYLQHTIFSFIYSLALSLLTFLSSILLSTFYHHAIPFLIFPAVILSTWYGNIKTGILAAVLTTAGLYLTLYARFPALLSPLSPLEFGIIFLSGVLGVIAIAKARQEDALREYREREKMYAKLLTKAGQANKQLSEQLKARDEFLSIVSHELKTPLTSMLLQLQTALYNITNVSLANFSVPNLLKMLVSAQEQSERLSRMINDLLNVSLIATGRFDLEKEQVDLGVLTASVIEQFREKVQRDGYKVTFEPQQSVRGVWDKLRIEQVVTNLLSNALKYGNKKPVEIGVSSAGSYAILSVTDHGIGIPPNQRKRIFDRFKRAVSSKKYQGFGVGLYITLQIIKAHDGTIEVRSSQKNGTTFVIRLPLAPRKKHLLKYIGAAKG